MMQRFITSISLVFFCGLLQGQNANPFDLKSRLPLIVATGLPEGPRNPFEVVAHRQPGISASFLEESATQGKARRRTIYFPEGNTLSKAFVFGALILMLIYFTFAAAVNRSALSKAWKSFLSANGLNVAQREAFGLAGNTPYLLLYINFLLNGGVFVFLTIQAFNLDGRYNNWKVFFLCLLISILIFLGKHLLIGFLRWLFPPLAADLSRYNFLIITFSCVLGFFLIPFNFLIAFAGNQEWQLFVTVWLVALSGIFIAYGLLRALSFGVKYLMVHPMHFLLYLCSAELVPAVLAARLLFY